MMTREPYLSLVAVSRNDDHGGNTLERTQVFVDSFLEQCARHRLDAELILVEWNPPSEKPSLAEALSWAEASEWAGGRVVTVPYERHLMLNYARSLPLFQMIGKNVGIRRARGEFVVATNIDILISEELFTYVARRELSPDRLYRCDRFDVAAAISDPAIRDKLDFAWENIVRRNERVKPWDLAGSTEPAAKLGGSPGWVADSGYFEEAEDHGLRMLTSKAEIPHNAMHLNACGDFTLMHRDAWARIGGYGEFELYSLHIDSFGVQCAHRAGCRETWLAPPAVCFHVEHAVGSGFTEGQKSSLYDRLAAQGIGLFDYDEVWPSFQRMGERGEPLEFNEEFWGMRDIPLDETWCGAGGNELQAVPAGERVPWDARVGALRAEFELLGWFRDVRRGVEAKADADCDTLRAALKACQDAFAAARDRWEADRLRLNGFLDKVRKDRDERVVREVESNRRHEIDLEKIAEGAERLRATRERLSAYRRVFGWLERLGFFK